MRNHYLRKIVKSAQKECVKVFCAEKKQHSGGVSCCQNAVSYLYSLQKVISPTFSAASPSACRTVHTSSVLRFPICNNA